MTAPLPKRIIKETERLQTEPVPGISAQPHDDNARYFDVMVQGPDGSCYEGEHGSEYQRILQCGWTIREGTDNSQAAFSISNSSSQTIIP